MSDASPRTIGRYQLRRELGRGMMGIVYEAHDPALSRTVALKTVRPGFASEGGEENFEKRFLTEARAAAALSHPGIVIVHDVGRDAETGTLFIALEYLNGKPLSEWTGPPMNWREALRISGRVAEALHEAHTHGVVHRDIKPANIMILPSGNPKIMDFGIAKVQSSQLTAAGQFFGTPLYMSPEQVLGAPVDARSDLFSLGAVLYLLLTGRQAFDGPSVPVILKRVLQEDPPAPSSIVPGLPPSVDDVVAGALAKRPGDRYPSARDFARALDEVRAGKTPKRPRRPVADSTLVSASVEDLGLVPLETPPASAAARHEEPLARSSEPPPGGSPGRTGSRSAALLAWGAAVIIGVVATVWWTQLPGPEPSPEGALAGRPSPVPTAAGMPPSPTGSPSGGESPAPAAEVAGVEPGPSVEARPEGVESSPPSPALATSPAAPPEAPASPAPGGVEALPPSPAPVTSAAKAPPHPTPRPTRSPSAKAGQLALDFEHPFKAATLLVFVDGDLVLEQEVEGKTSKELIALKVHKGTLQKALPVPPGRHVVRVDVHWEGNQKSDLIVGVFTAGATRRLTARVGRIRKDLSLEWK